MAAFYAPFYFNLPTWQVLALVNEKRKQERKQELWRVYMANLVTMWGGKDTKTYTDVLADYEAAMKPQQRKADEVKAAYRNAEATIRALEKSRKG